MMDRLIELARYHDTTKHSLASLRASPQHLDWDNLPLPFKIYSALDAAASPGDVGRLCLLSNGVLRWRRTRAGEVHGFRAAPCTGALYHIELYLANAAREGLAAGLYHYGAHDGGLRRLREGDLRGALAEAAGGFPALAGAPLVLILTSTFWRNAWKYRARAYRHAYWDGGAVLANVLELGAGDGLRTAAVMGFDDGAVNWLLGVDGEREAAVAVVALGEGTAAPPAGGREPPALELATTPLSPREVRYPEIEAAHRASSLPSGRAAALWRDAVKPPSPGIPPALVPSPEEAIRRRRSTRRFGRGAISLTVLEQLLAAAAAPVPGDSFAPGLITPFVIVNAVDGLRPGAYGPELEPIRAGDLRRQAAALALGQNLGGEAAADIYFLSDLAAVGALFGERGYRVAQMAGGIAGARVELSATAQGLAASGLTFFDDEVTKFFEPASAGRQVMYLVAVGQRPG
ncbi:MAG: SagB family peptide dehydrogenase [Candidatus Dormibacteraeota bacterium]|nr:SagB family peptide dehydrogenase [Candidatus Dormibacteraeota bacterium]MBO0762469.1 SagB family peptide dehydrogenase [Candidatus Dormibacteraeota bacterium]